MKDAIGTSPLSAIVANSIGDFAALALSEDGQAWSWGSSHGGITLGRTSTSTGPDLVPLPDRVRNSANNGPLTGIVAVASGSDNVATLADDGTVYAWGSRRGQGNGALAAVFPVQVRAIGGQGVLSNVVALSAGWNWTAALTADGKVVTWGYNSTSNVLGQGSTVTDIDLPGYVIRDSDGQPITDIVAISAGYNFGLAQTTNGQLYGWGDNAYGQLGQGSFNTGGRRALLVKTPDGTAPLSNVPMAIAGGSHALALDTTGAVWSWGYSQNGQLGDGVNHPRVNQSALPAPVVSSTGIGQMSNIAAIATGYASSLALTSDGQLLMWGQGLGGQLGQGPSAGTANSFVPVLVKDPTGSAPLSLGPIGSWPNLTRRAR